MKNNRLAHLLPLVLAAALTLTLPGCATTQSQINQYNAVLYVQGLLDETYTGAPSAAYQTLTGRTADDALDAFNDNVSAEYTQRLAPRFALDDALLTPAQRADYHDLLRRLYAAASYTVGPATALDGGRYCVELSVTPVTFLADAYTDGYDTLKQSFADTHLPPEEDPSRSAAQNHKLAQRYAQAWADAVYDYLLSRLDALTTGPAVTRLVLLTPDAQGLYTLSPTDLQDVDDLILQY